MIAPRRRARRLVADTEAFSIPQIMAFRVPAGVRDKRREFEKAKLPFVFGALHPALVSARRICRRPKASLLPSAETSIGAGPPKTCRLSKQDQAQ
ncbi:MAG TPA: hypothetical protein VN523_05925 [Hyphomicrobiaceae bacterium]|jgi:hypothetical protein|nr:hypothetical protein [Hyphomicrobiaceae bacterium]